MWGLWHTTMCCTCSDGKATDKLHVWTPGAAGIGSVAGLGDPVVDAGRLQSTQQFAHDKVAHLVRAFHSQGLVRRAWVSEKETVAVGATAVVCIAVPQSGQ